MLPLLFVAVDEVLNLDFQRVTKGFVKDRAVGICILRGELTAGGSFAPRVRVAVSGVAPLHRWPMCELRGCRRSGGELEDFVEVGIVGQVGRRFRLRNALRSTAESACLCCYRTNPSKQTGSGFNNVFNIVPSLRHGHCQSEPQRRISGLVYRHLVSLYRWLRSAGVALVASIVRVVEAVPFTMKAFGFDLAESLAPCTVSQT